MTFKQYLVIPVLISLLATTLILMAKLFPGSSSAVGGPGLLTFVSFQAWALYFTAGATPKAGVEVFLSTVVAIALSFSIVLLKPTLAVALGSAAEPNDYVASAVTVFIIAIPMIAIEKVPLFGYLPAVFVGAGMFFAIMTLGGEVALVNGVAVKVGIPHSVAGFMSVAIPQLIGCAVGLLYGFMSVVVRGIYEAKVTRGTAAKVLDDK